MGAGSLLRSVATGRVGGHVVELVEIVIDVPS
jgi:hypothetical protein